MVRKAEAMSRERLDHYIIEAAKVAGYEQGFGVKGCDLSLRHWWSAYARQSTREQAENIRDDLAKSQKKRKSDYFIVRK